MIVPSATERTIKTQLDDFAAPKILTYSLESTIAEKLDAILQRFELTGRMKDFYDIYYLSQTFDFDGLKLQTAIAETLQNRGTDYNADSFKRITELVDDDNMHQVAAFSQDFAYDRYSILKGDGWDHYLYRTSVECLLERRGIPEAVVGREGKVGIISSP